MGEDEVGSFGLFVAGEAGFHRCGGGGFAVYERGEPPTAGRGVFDGVFDHKLNIRGSAGDERLGLAKDLVIFRRGDVAIVQSGDNSAVGEWKLPLAIGLDRYIVAQYGTNAVQLACFVGDGDPPPVPVSGGDFCHERWGRRVIGV
jgi:hypothetical protein